MDFKYYLPTRIVFGLDCIIKEKELLQELGGSALVVTGQSSARLSGALDDICKALDSLKISYDVFAGVNPNPTFDNIRTGATRARETRPDMIIGVGGGSPLDAAKAIALLATNQVDVEDLFKGGLSRPALPVVAIPTTAGSGSEVTPYSILTYDALQTKKSISYPSIMPRVAFLDARYTMTLPRAVTADTACDAFSHALEGYLSSRANPVSDTLAREAMQVLGKRLGQLAAGMEPDLEAREDLLYAALLAGMVIAQTATSVIHALGYPLTYFKGIPHGRANAYLIEEFLHFNREHLRNWPKLDDILDFMQVNSIAELGDMLRNLTGQPPKVTEEELARYAHLASQAKNATNCPMVPSEVELLVMLRNALLA